MKVVITGDVHAHNYRNFDQDGRRLGNTIRLLEELWDKAAELNGILAIVGDIFNNMQTVSTQAMVSLTELFTRKSAEHKDTLVLLISGNHDMATKNLPNNPAISSVHALADLADNINCIDLGDYLDPSGFVIAGVPYYPNPDDFSAMLSHVTNNLPRDAEKRYLLMHQTVGFMDLVPDDIDPEDPLFDSYDAVFNGHIHKGSQVTQKFYNVGSPIHRDAGDIGQDKSYLILDTDTNEVERVYTTGYPVFRQIEEGEEIPEDWADDYVKIIPKQIEVSVDEEEIREQFDHNRVSREELLNNFVSMKLDDDLNGDAITAYGQSLLRYVS